MSGLFGVLRRDGRAISRRDLVSPARALEGRLRAEARTAQAAEIAVGGDVLLRRDLPGRSLWIVADVRLDDPRGLATRLGCGELGGELEESLGRAPSGVEPLHADTPLARPPLEATGAAEGASRGPIAPSAALRGASARDAALVLAAYERWGETCVDHLCGDFAFAIWDGRRRALFLARDPMGVRPLFMCATPALFAFASEIKGILALEEVPRRLDRSHLGELLLQLFDDRTSTLYRDVRRLSPGSTLVIPAVGAPRSRLYWAPSAGDPGRWRSAAQCTEAFRATFAEAVRCRMDGVGVVGSTVSGGLDSSSVAAQAQIIRSSRGLSPVHGFSAVFPGADADSRRFIDESAHMRAVVEHSGIDSHVVPIVDLDPLADLDELLDTHDEFFQAPNLYIHRALYREARRVRAQVLLDGLDGDSVVGHGTERFAELFLAGRWLALWRALGPYARNYRRSRLGLIRDRCLAPTLFDPLRQRGAASAGRLRRCWPPAAALAPDFARELDLEDRLQARWIHAFSPPPGARSAHVETMAAGLHPRALELVDRTARRAGLEARFPFYDRRLIDLCLSFPAEQMLDDGFTRIVLRRATSGLLPEEVRWRASKANLTSAFVQGMVTHGREQITAAREDERVGEFMDRLALAEAHRRFQASPLQHPPAAILLATACVLARWLERADFVP